MRSRTRVATDFACDGLGRALSSGADAVRALRRFERIVVDAGSVWRLDDSTAGDLVCTAMHVGPGAIDGGGLTVSAPVWWREVDSRGVSGRSGYMLRWRTLEVDEHDAPTPEGSPRSRSAGAPIVETEVWEMGSWSQFGRSGMATGGARRIVARGADDAVELDEPLYLSHRACMRARHLERTLRRWLPPLADE